ncbi:alpha/beta-hydrolase [Mycena rosella]|uniref:Alpha/beta-hydrolase n=1 Tax=Mycena rosella TaxID=1033263 RepID=A0AAD7CVE9_MYCRO|nr:alpha/beta-hydrolase [Mycena rosella]
MAFRFRQQPQKTLYLLVGAIYLLLRVPVWVVRNLVPSWRPRPKWSLGRTVFLELVNAATALLLETSLPAPESLEKLAASADKTGFVWVEPAPHLVLGDIQRFAELNGVSSARAGGCWYGPRGSDNSVGQKASPGEKVLYHMHGGGFVMGSASPSFSPSASMFKGLLEHTPQISRIFAVEYRLAAGPPLEIMNPFPAALIDVIAGYRYLVEEVGVDPANIIIGGDSAGGILAYQLARHLTTIDASILPNAGALLLLSPSADSGLRPNPGSMLDNKRSDYVRSWFDARYSVNSLLGSLPADELDKPWLSPGSTVFTDADIRGMFKAFPPTFILAGEAEMSRDCMRVLRDRMQIDMGPDGVTYVEIANAPHDFLGMSILEPERTEALVEIAKWARGLN